ncbi:EAL domain-containing protein (putative c-di-GMP-specific phosphodiesterase class I)/GGDEF domain-containing protein [Actimicrobium sp. GrIS 1.19]|uniref:putative bifunctional diguanylate cyclase/phosphodiesterase n=1 Tax=Actimicrobium sp. GrIS 1.19 TaxID=3071708 RepID=UPI002E09ABB2|nr:EAL domain-containing protein (putative c-di-GMP-specific phosphodiesterase class I)/GGDEF domain-containing protein [Actimicrobium sp. GrIS 1.19]
MGVLQRLAAVFRPVPQARASDLEMLCQRLEIDLRAADGTATLAVLIVSLARSDIVDATLRQADSHRISIEMMQRVANTLRPGDYLAQASADEIWVILPRLASAALANLAANNIMRVLEAPIVSLRMPLTLRPRIGIALASDAGGIALHLLRAAEEASRRARNLNQPYFVVTEVEGVDLHNKDLVVALENALAHNLPTLAYQPKVDILTRQVVSVEALIRWPAGLKPAMTPMMLVDLAEQFGMIRELTRFVLHTALREQSSVLAAAGINRIWINLSAKMLTDPDLLDFLQQALDIWSATPAMIGLELTESMLASDIDQSIAMMHALSQHGFALAIDDFGTGYSSLAYLRRFPITELKIDKMFVQHMATSIPDAQIVRTIINLAHNFHLDVVAEGVEDEEILALLAAMGCDQIQGYVYARPMPAGELVQWLANFTGAPAAAQLAVR